MLIKLLWVFGASAYVVAVVLIIQWFSLSIVITHSGPVEWKKGWTIVECQWKDCEE